MATLNIKNIPEKLYRELKQHAKHHHRSLNKEAIMILEQALYRKIKDRDEILQQAREMRSKVKNYYLTEAELKKTKNLGRE